MSRMAFPDLSSGTVVVSAIGRVYPGWRGGSCRMKEEQSIAEPAYTRSLPDREDGRSWPAQGRWTYEDYLRLPDDGNRYEVIRGVLYVTAAPFVRHQLVVGE